MAHVCLCVFMLRHNSGFYTNNWVSKATEQFLNIHSSKTQNFRNQKLSGFTQVPPWSPSTAEALGPARDGAQLTGLAEPPSAHSSHAGLSWHLAGRTPAAPSLGGNSPTGDCGLPWTASVLTSKSLTLHPQNMPQDSEVTPHFPTRPLPLISETDALVGLCLTSVSSAPVQVWSLNSGPVRGHPVSWGSYVRQGRTGPMLGRGSEPVEAWEWGTLAAASAVAATHGLRMALQC